MNSTKWSSLTEFAKHLGREGIVNVKEDEKDGLMIAWRDTSVAATKRREEIREQELAEARSGAGEDKMLKKMAKRAQEEADKKARIMEARKAAQKDSASPLADEKPSASPTEEKKEENAEINGEAPKAEAAPAKLSFGLKAKTAPPNKAGLGQMKSQSVFKRARVEKESSANGDEKPKKKVKL